MTKNLTEGDPTRLIFFFALPLVAGNMMQQLYAFIDTLIVGRFLGVNALAAVGCTGSLMFLALGFLMGFCTGVTIYTGQRFGAGDRAGVRQSAAACIMLGVAVALTLTAIVLPLTRTLLVLMETPPEILDGAYDFISIVFAGLTIFLLLYLQNCLIRALGDSTKPMILLAVTLGINIALEPIAILILGWGIPGAALATVISQAIGALLFYIYIRRRVPVLHTRWSDWKPNRAVLMAHLRMGLPMAFQSSVIAIGAIIVQVALNNLGALPVAAYAATQKIDAVAVMPMLSFGYAMAAYTAQNYGAQKYERIRMGVHACLKMSMAFAVSIGILLIAFGTFFLELFVGADAAGAEEVIAYGHTYLVVTGSTYTILALLLVYRNVLQGLGQSVIPTIAGAMELIMRAGAAVFLCGTLGFLGACLANPLAWLGAAIPVTIAYFWTERTLCHAS
ncbi:MATE family efflux transporter [Selenomonas timonae]|uniref:MATE family efflux transporter n=1 Tax=Selenomonas timonae TaxID=2754044 RepID=A0A7G7VH93_9FIRM|nr:MULTISPECIES: MATE family efflux transporter [Selenomonas]EJO21208.1 MATE efflux family protein [Selenomonas sp. FOBRC6]QNH53486.1 MATE family efflux transporter [Selenomonas timonae]